MFNATRNLSKVTVVSFYSNHYYMAQGVHDDIYFCIRFGEAQEVTEIKMRFRIMPLPSFSNIDLRLYDIL